MVDNHEFKRLVAQAVSARIKDLSDELMHWIGELEKMEKGGIGIGTSAAFDTLQEPEQSQAAEEVFILLGGE